MSALPTLFTVTAISAVVLTYAGNAMACDKTSCIPTPTHYDELGCTPVLDEERCCPIRYECPERLGNGIDSGCQYRGKVYKVGETIKGQLMPKPCIESCKCENWEDEETYKFKCIALDEPDYAASNVLVKMLDRKIDAETHDPADRCYGMLIEDPKKAAKIKKTKCKYDGNVYRKGEKITPDGTCFECICDESLARDTSTIDVFHPSCQRRQCGFGISGDDQNYLNNGCVPVYDRTKTTCCPIDWRCPTETDVIKRSGIPASQKLQCKFGDHTLKLLDAVMYEEGDKLNCKCYTPPMVHCLKNI